MKPAAGSLRQAQTVSLRPPSGDPAFTLVELMAAVAVIAVGMVFILGAFNQCLSSMNTAGKTVTAVGLMNDKLQHIDSEHIQNNGSQEGSWSGGFEQDRYQGFNWSQVVRPVEQDFGNETVFAQDGLNEETVSVSWKQGKVIKDVSVTRFVKRIKE